LCILFRTQRHDEEGEEEVEKAFLKAVTQAVVLLGAADLLGMVLEGTTDLIGKIATVPVEITVEIIGTIFEMTVGGIVLEECLSVPHYLFCPTML